VSRQPALLLVLPLLLLAGGAAAHDYPSVDLVQYVEACIRDHPDRPRQEMLYKCACAIDAIAEQIPYDEFVDAATALNAGQVAGPRGTAVRESKTGQELAGRLRQAQKAAFARCLIE
jgi:hypothetical protein